MSALTKASTSADTEVTIATEVHPTAEENFCLFYHRTARALRAYLRRMLADPSHADDLLQESYLRLLRAKLPADMSDDHQKNYLFRIATNLLRDEAAQNKALPITGETRAPERVRRCPTARRPSPRYERGQAPRTRAALACICRTVQPRRNRHDSGGEDPEYPADALPSSRQPVRGFAPDGAN